MTVIPRSLYLNRLIAKKNNSRVKIITGIRRCGKSYLLFHLYKDYLLTTGVDENHIVEIALDKKKYDDLRDPNQLYKYILKHIQNNSEQYYIFIDEIQLSYRIKKDIDVNLIADEDIELLYTTFYDILNDLMSHENIDIYVTGSNSKMLSTDIATNFRDRGDEIRLYPLSFAEVFANSKKEKSDTWEDYIVYGGMPLVVLEPNENEKRSYLTGLFHKVYVADIVERYKIKDESLIDGLINVLASSVGSLTNPTKLANTMNSVNHVGTSDKTVKKYLDILEDAFIFKKADRYDVKGKAYFNYPMKYYAVDVGLRNARLNFRQVEKTHLMENILYNELVIRGYSVDIGVIRLTEINKGKKTESMHEIDFVVNYGAKKAYIQSAFSITDEDKKNREILPLLNSGDFFKKIVVTSGTQKPYLDENGIIYVGIIPFLLDEEIINF
jgi:hypothetical protein